VSASAPRTHVVQKGQNLTVIARKYGVSLNALVAANPKLSPRRIQAGATLRIPAAEPGAAPAERQDVQVHQVKAGDSFSSIARTYDVSVNSLIEANPGVNPKRLQRGQKIRIPAPTQG
jgi:LysM repeat protein